MGLKSPKSGQQGLSLVELLMAISMSSLVIGMSLALFKDFGFAARLSQGRRDAGFQARAFFGGLSRNLMTGGGILALEPGRMELLNSGNRRVEYVWEDSTLKVNGKAWDMRVASMEVEPFGPARPGGEDGFSAEAAWELDSLDGNRDGILDFSELDRDRDGELDAEEGRYIAHIRLTLTIMDRDVPLTQTCVVHPRNRAPSARGPASGDISWPEGIPEP